MKERDHQPQALERRVFENIVFSSVIVRQAGVFPEVLVEKHQQLLDDLRDRDDFHRDRVDFITGMPIDKFRVLFEKVFAPKQTR